MRASSYLIYVDLPGNSDDVILVHGFTNTFCKVPRTVASYVRSLESRQPPKPLYGNWVSESSMGTSVEEPSQATLRVLVERGFLTNLNVLEEERLFRKVVETLHASAVSKMPSYMFMPTYDCNLRCSYCYQNYFRTNPLYRDRLKLMPLEIVDRIFRAFPNIEARHGVLAGPGSRRNIGFFGGEPFLAKSRPVVEKIMNEACKMGSADFWAVSNGTELDAYKDLLSPNHISDIQITIDGPPSEHDKRRIFADGTGSFRRIADNITMALENGVKISVRVNVDRNNIGSLPDFVDAISEYHWGRFPGFGVYASPVRKFGSNVAKETTFNTLELKEALIDMQKKHPGTSIIAKPDSGLKARARQIFSSPDEVDFGLRESACSAHSDLYMFDAFANIYVCWEHVGELESRLGFVRTDGSLDVNIAVQDEWRTRTVASNDVCRQCRYALHCGGGCAASAQQASGQVHSNFCDAFGNRFRIAVAEAYSEVARGVKVADSSAVLRDAM